MDMAIPTHHGTCHTISWDTITKPKGAGGLGIVPTQYRNVAILMNQAWPLWGKPDILWAKVLKAKYFPNSS